jgi:hypothetical protein
MPGITLGQHLDDNLAVGTRPQYRIYRGQNFVESYLDDTATH